MINNPDSINNLIKKLNQVPDEVWLEAIKEVEEENMGETIESMIQVLQTEVDFIKDKVKFNNLSLNGNLEQFKNLDKDEKQRLLYVLEHLKINAEHYINKIK